MTRFPAHSLRREPILDDVANVLRTPLRDWWGIDTRHWQLAARKLCGDRISLRPDVDTPMAPSSTPSATGLGIIGATDYGRARAAR